MLSVFTRFQTVVFNNKRLINGYNILPAASLQCHYLGAK